jgi:hypothetical protein
VLVLVGILLLHYLSALYYYTLEASMEPQLSLVLERIEIAHKASKPFIQMSDALVLYNAVINMHSLLADKSN